MCTSELFTSHCQVSFIVQQLSNGIKGHTFFSVLSDCLIDKQLMLRIVVAGESRGTVSDGKVEGYVCSEKLPLTPYKRYGWMMGLGGI